MAVNESLPDSGGHYYDSDTGGLTGTLRRNFGNAKAEITSGSAGATAVGTAIGFIVAAMFGKRLGGM